MFWKHFVKYFPFQCGFSSLVIVLMLWGFDRWDQLMNILALDVPVSIGVSLVAAYYLARQERRHERQRLRAVLESLQEWLVRLEAAPAYMVAEDGHVYDRALHISAVRSTIRKIKGMLGEPADS